MKIDVYDTYAQSKEGHVIHFDVFVEQGASGDKAFKYGKEFLEEIGEDGDTLQQSRCNFCHTEQADTKVQDSISDRGYYILQMEGCPNSII